MKVVVLQSNYIPWRGYFDLIQNADVFVFYDNVKYTKNDWRNRNQVCSSKGVHWITIPVCKSSENKNISEVALDYNVEWRKSHLSLIEFCYSKAPFYQKQTKPLMNHFLNEFHTNSLSELNQYVIKTLSSHFGFSTKFESSQKFLLRENRIERLLDLLVNVSTTKYITGPSAKDYLIGSQDLFKDKGIQIEFYEYPEYFQYNTFENSYLKQSSILDCLSFLPIDEIKDHFKRIKYDRETT